MRRFSYLAIIFISGQSACTPSQDWSKEPIAPGMSGGPIDGGEPISGSAPSATGGSQPAPLNRGNETTPDKALSVVDLGEFRGPMSNPLGYMFWERHPEAAPGDPISTLQYSVSKLDPNGALVGLIVRLAFSGEATTVRLGQDGYIGIWEPGVNGEQWDSVGGTATIRPDANGSHARVDVTMEFQGVVTKQRRTLTGFFEGQLWHSCYVLYTRPDRVGGPTGTDYMIDEDWSSPFCASVKPK
jgi:hypothetical protein